METSSSNTTSPGTTTGQQPWWKKCCTYQHWLHLRHLPDACTNEEHEAWVLQQRRRHRETDDDQRSPFVRFLSRERNLLIVTVVVVIFLNFAWGRWILYPFRLLTTWVHEMCHGLAAILTGGRIGRLQIFHDGSGLAFTRTRSQFASGFTSSGGYPGTFVCILCCEYSGNETKRLFMHWYFLFAVLTSCLLRIL